MYQWPMYASCNCNESNFHQDTISWIIVLKSQNYIEIHIISPLLITRWIDLTIVSKTKLVSHFKSIGITRLICILHKLEMICINLWNLSERLHQIVLLRSFNFYYSLGTLEPSNSWDFRACFPKVWILHQKID